MRPKSLRLPAVQRGLDRFPVMGGKGASATGWGYKHRRAATCSLPGDTALWVGGRGSVADADGGSCALATGRAYNQPKADCFFTSRIRRLVSIALNPDLPELIQIVMTVYDFACLFIPCLPQIPE